MKVTFWIPLTSVAFANEGFISGSGFGTGFSPEEGFPEGSGAPVSMTCRDYDNWQGQTWEDDGWTETCEAMEEMGWCSGGDLLEPREEFFPGTIVGQEGIVFAWEACCICGGGMHETPEPEPASKCDGLIGARCRNREGCIWKNKKRQCLEAARTIGISMECRDYENWQAPTWESGFTVTCDSMEEMGWWCSGGDLLEPREEFFPSEEGLFAWDACCICGGGMHETPEPTAEPEPASKCDGLVGPRCRNREGCIWKNKKRQCLEAAQVCPELKGHSCRKRKGCEWKNRECVPEATGNDVCPAQCMSAFLAAGGCEAMRGHGDFEAVVRDVPEECGEYECDVFDACHMTEAEIAKFGQMMAEEICAKKGGKKSCKKAGCIFDDKKELCMAPGVDTGGPTISPMNECAELSGFTCRRRSQTCEWKNRKCVLKGDDMNSETMEGPTWEHDDSDCSRITKGFTCRRRFGCAWTNGQCVSKGQRRLPSEVELQAPTKA